MGEVVVLFSLHLPPPSPFLFPFFFFFCFFVCFLMLPKVSFSILGLVYTGEEVGDFKPFSSFFYFFHRHHSHHLLPNFATFPIPIRNSSNPMATTVPSFVGHNHCQGMRSLLERIGSNISACGISVDFNQLRSSSMCGAIWIKYW